MTRTEYRRLSSGCRRMADDHNTCLLHDHHVYECQAWLHNYMGGHVRWIRLEEERRTFGYNALTRPYRRIFQEGGLS